MAYDHTTYEAYAGQLTSGTDPTDTLVDGLCTKAAALLAAKVTTVTYTNAAEANVLNMIVDRMLARENWKEQGYANSINTPAGSVMTSKEPVLWTQEIIDEVWAVYGVDITGEPSNAGSPWTHITAD